MVFQKGNEYWKKRTRHGRESQWYPETIRVAAEEFMQWCQDNPIPEEKVFQHQGQIVRATVHHPRAPTLAGFAVSLGYGREGLMYYLDQEDFLQVKQWIKDAFYQHNVEHAAAGQLNARIISQELGMQAKKQVEIVDPLTELMKEIQEANVKK